MTFPAPETFPWQDPALREAYPAPETHSASILTNLRAQLEQRELIAREEANRAEGNVDTAYWRGMRDSYSRVLDMLTRAGVTS